MSESPEFRSEAVTEKPKMKRSTLIAMLASSFMALAAVVVLIIVIVSPPAQTDVQAGAAALTRVPVTPTPSPVPTAIMLTSNAVAQPNGILITEPPLSDKAAENLVEALEAEGVPLLVNKERPLTAAFVPESLVLVSNYVQLDGVTVIDESASANRDAALALAKMLEAAIKQGVSDWQIEEGYRSYETQAALWQEKYDYYINDKGYKESKAKSSTNKRVSPAGTSDYQTGLAFRLSVKGKSFQNTSQYKWLVKNAMNYGFIIRFTEAKEAITGMTAEPWHIRYVGTAHAREMDIYALCLEEYVQKREKELSAN
ncbi:MAG: M15 family metallopeptidase [Eubacteriales bacterium]|nr:M15 family metallopeptidase [Eubacteriales bacterium]MDD3881165.1 M15 family metallopeptidase [Eubacteriales bacterium]MDD4511547.1 M15 family metallopeptidase [Eubacteriales bacterium]